MIWLQGNADEYAASKGTSYSAAERYISISAH